MSERWFFIYKKVASASQIVYNLIIKILNAILAKGILLWLQYCSLLSSFSAPVSGAEMDTLKTLYNRRRSGFTLPYQFYHYVNDEIQLNESGKITGLNAYVALSSRNMISTTALRSELEILYEEMSPDFLEEECCLAQEIAGPLELLCRRKKS